MKSLSWPKMFSSTNTVLNEDKAAIYTNLKLLLSSERLSLFGDPYFGTCLYQAAFRQNTGILIDLLIEEIYSTIQIYMPQLIVERKDISIYSNKESLIGRLKVTYRKDRTTDLYFINLTNNLEEGS
jgi:hypothetical protein